MTNKQLIMITGQIGLLAAVLRREVLSIYFERPDSSVEVFGADSISL